MQHSALLLLPCQLLLTVPGALTLAPPATKVAHQQLRLPPDQVDYEQLQVNGTCMCRQICFAFACFCYTLMETDADTLDCLISRNDVYKPNMVADANATTVCHSDYLQSGERFYRIIPNLMPLDGRTQCKAQNAELAVLDTEEKMKELAYAMKRAGVVEVWTALYFTFTEKKGRWHGTGAPGKLAGINPSNPIWAPYHLGWFTLALTELGPTFLNQHVATDLLPLACQRDY